MKPRYARADSFSSSECAIEEDEPTEFPYDRNREIIQLIKRKDKVKVGSVCGKCHSKEVYMERGVCS